MPHDEEKKIGHIEPDKRPDKLERLQRQFIDRIEKLPKKLGELKELPKGLEIPHDVFRKGSVIPRFLRSVQRRLESSKVYRSFRLPGTDHIVHDRREEVKRGKTPAGKDAEKAVFQIKEGKIEEVRKKTYENYLAEKMPLAAQIGAEKAAVQVKRPLSPFEKMIIERFEKGTEIAKESEDGRPHFFEKSESEWKSFFNRFIARTVLRKKEIAGIKEFIYRGLMSSKKSADQKVLVSDMVLKSGKIEKFIRFGVLAERLGMPFKLPPGSTLTADMIAKALQGEVLKYLALASKHKGREIKTGLEATKGLFMSKKTEERIVGELGILTDREESVRRGGERRVRRRWGGIFGGEEGAPEGERERFVPWWSWDREERTGKRRWFVALIIILLFVLLGLAAVLGTILHF